MSTPEKFNLYHFYDKFIVQPVFGETSRVLEIDRYGQSELRLNASTMDFTQSVKMEKIHGIIGIANLVSGPYLIVIKSVISVGTLNDSEILRIASTDVIPFRSELHLTEHEKKINQNLLEMLLSFLSTDGFYYSLQMDLSHTLQWLSENSNPNFHEQPFLQRIDQRYVWNAKLCTKFNTVEISKFVYPIIHGFVGVRQCIVNHISFKLAVISRRSVNRAGVRFHMRGADAEGNCANFIETEQIVEYDSGLSQSQSTSKYITSFVQMRGSIPLYWSQKPNLKWQPDPSLKNLDEQYQCFCIHLEQLFQSYGREALSGIPRKIVILNLINHYGRENTIGQQLQSVINKLNIPNVKYLAFDFHRHCQSLNWERLSILKQRLEPDIYQFGFFYTHLIRHNNLWIDSHPEILYQSGFFRTNCMDCLDRTNVVQALLGMESLRLQLQYLGIIGESVTNFNAWPDFIYIFKNLWADNGDDCSKQYSGTAALKSDYTRIGKRTLTGAIGDAYNAINRYFKNNFTDGFRQDSINLFLGNYLIDKDNLPEHIDHFLLKFDANGAAIAATIFSAAMTLLCVVVSENISATLFWFALFLGFTVFIWLNGDKFVDQPLLLPSLPRFREF